jgi:hypothetical protein
LEQLARFLERRSSDRSSQPARTHGRDVFLATAQAAAVAVQMPVPYWRDPQMVERWVASAWLLTEKHFRKLNGHKDLWALATILGRPEQVQSSQEKVA